MTDSLPVGEWRAHDPRNGTIPSEIDRMTYVDVMRADGSVDWHSPACIWNWSDMTDYGPIDAPILAWRVSAETE
jgi:hypothetical protein